MYLVAQCWDDGVVNDIIVADICRKYNAKATFNINPGKIAADKRITGWVWSDFQVDYLSVQEMLEHYKGFQVASHTMTHPFPAQITPAKFRREAVDARKFIEDTFQQSAPGFAWPYGEFTPQCTAILAEENFIYGRTVSRGFNSGRANPLTTPVNCHYLDCDFFDCLAKAKKDGVFYFWGHSYEMKDNPDLIARYDKIIQTISADPEAEWVNVVDLFRQRQ